VSEGRDLTLEGIFSSKGRVKILKAIFIHGEINISQLIKITGLNYRVVSKHLEYLKNIGIIEELSIGRVKIYRPNWLNPHTRIIDEFIRLMEGS